MSCYKNSKNEIMITAWFLASNRKPNGGINCAELSYYAGELSFLNVQSVNSRYSTRLKRHKFIPNDFQFIDFRQISMEQVVKCVECYLYQCSEHPRYDKNSIFLELREFVENKKSQDGFDFNAYDSADWGYYADDLPAKEPKNHDEFVKDYELIYCVSYRK